MAVVTVLVGTFVGYTGIFQINQEDNMKIRVGLIYGGRSCEHEVSIRSAYNIANAFNRDLYELIPIAIDKQGHWQLGNYEQLCGKSISRSDARTMIMPISSDSRVQLVQQDSGQKKGEIDVFFPIVHGTYGEDGALQGLLRLLNVPFVGSGVLGSAIGMDKDVMKRLLRDAGIPIAQFLTIHERDRQKLKYADVVAQLGETLFVKPCNLGSSVGVSKVASENEFQKALTTAFTYDRKILIEEAIRGREIECSILGNDSPISSVPGEIRVKEGFYSYDAKYTNKDDAVIEIPAILHPMVSKNIQDIAIDVFLTLECAGMARVDFFLKPNGNIVVNEINTIPGFTSTSMYPKLWEASGIDYAELLHRLVQLAIEIHTKESVISRSVALDAFDVE